MDNCAVIRFVTRRPDGSNRAHPQMPVPLEALTHIPRGWRVRREFIRTKPSCISRLIPNIWTGAEKSQASGSLARVLFLNRPTNSQGLTEKIRHSSFPWVQNGGNEIETYVPTGNSVLGRYWNLYLKIQNSAQWKKKGLYLLPFYEVINPTRYQDKNYWIHLGQESRAECPEISWDFGIQREMMQKWTCHLPAIWLWTRSWILCISVLLPKRWRVKESNTAKLQFSIWHPINLWYISLAFLAGVIS